MNTIITTQKFISFRMASGSYSFDSSVSGNSKQRRTAVRKWLSLDFSVEKSSRMDSDGSSKWVVTKKWAPK